METLLEDYEQHKEGKKRLAEIVVGNDLIEEEPAPPVAVPTTTAPPMPMPTGRDVDTGCRPDRSGSGRGRAAWKCWHEYAKFKKAHAKNGAEHKLSS
ncbi:hypothetical protein NB693_23235 [Pantoea ananatis]|uniref:hypothetical protein n=1 Tax=Pantoea ananas TaxID=553 RepID=UPI00222039DE|nr:hypothetical protein [Pantoea ananatis]